MDLLSTEYVPITLTPGYSLRRWDGGDIIELVTEHAPHWWVGKIVGTEADGSFRVGHCWAPEMGGFLVRPEQITNVSFKAEGPSTASKGGSK